MPAESSTNLPSAPFQPPSRRQPPPPPPAGGVAGPPSIGLGDAGRHNELDLGPDASSDALQLDHHGGFAPPQPPPGIDLPEDSGLGLSLSGDVDDPAADLPSPVSSPGNPARGRRPFAAAPPTPTPFSPPPAEPSLDPLADLPSPKVAARPKPFGRPSAPPLTDPLADLPSPKIAARPNPFGAPADPTADLPSPVGYDGNRPRPAMPGSSAPVPPSQDAALLDLPVPVDQARAEFAEDLPVPVDFDLPMDLAPAEADPELDLPIPANLPGLAGQEVQPAEMGMSPASQDVIPTLMDLEPKLGGDELAPSNLPGQAHDADGLAPVDGLELDRGGIPGGGAAPAPNVAQPTSAAAGPATTARPTPNLPTKAKRPAVSRGVLLLGGGLLVIGLAGAGVLYSGLLDPEDPQPAALRGGGKKGGAKGADGGGTVAAGPATERSEAVLAAMAKHTPAAYLTARTTATEAGDIVGAAEAALLLHYHYGPNLALATEAATALAPYRDNEEPFVRRVVGLAALAGNDLAAAETALAGDDPRTRLYRGWLRLAQDNAEQADAEAKAVAAAAPNDRAAVHLGLAVAALRDPNAAADSIVVETASHPEDLGLQGLLIDTALSVGRIAIAKTAAEALDPATVDDPSAKAWMEIRRARVAQAQGDHAGAIEAYDRAVELAPSSALTVERIRALIAAKRFNEAASAANKLARERPEDLEVQFLQAEVAIQTGDGDIALQVLDTLAAATPEDPRVLLYRGEVHAMRLAVEEAQTAFAAARALAPDNVEIAIAEARLLAAAKQLDAALALLDTATTAAKTAERNADLAKLTLVTAELYLDAGRRPEAIAALDAALAAAPGNNDAQLQRGILAIDSGEIDSGKADLAAVFERTSGYPGLAAPLGRIYVAEENYAALERLLGDHLRGDQTRDGLLVIGARLRLHQGKIPQARVLLETALTRNSTDWEAHMLMAQVLIAEGRSPEALAQLERARPPSPQPELMLQRGKVFEFNAKHNDAMPEYRQALALNPDLHEARFLYGRLLGFSGANGKAIAELQQVADASSAKTAPWYPEVWLAIGRSQQALGKPDEAIASLKQATTLKPTFGEAFAEEGRFHEFRNKHANAIAALSQARKLGTAADHWYAGALMDLGRAQAKSGKNGDAKATLREFLTVASPEDPSRAEAERLVREL